MLSTIYLLINHLYLILYLALNNLQRLTSQKTQPTNQCLHRTELCRHWVSSRRPTQCDDCLGWMGKKSQRNPCCWHAMMIMIFLILFLFLFFIYFILYVVCTYMCVCMSVCPCIWMSVCFPVCVCLFLCVCLCERVYASVCVSFYLYVSMSG